MKGQRTGLNSQRELLGAPGQRATLWPRQGARAARRRTGQGTCPASTERKLAECMQSHEPSHLALMAARIKYTVRIGHDEHFIKTFFFYNFYYTMESPF